MNRILTEKKKQNFEEVFMRKWSSLWCSGHGPLIGIFELKNKFSVSYKANNCFYQNPFLSLSLSNRTSPHAVG